MSDSSNSRNTSRETQIADHWTGRRRLSVSFDDKCQAVGDNFAKFNSFLGTLAGHAKILPPTKSDWREVLLSLKEDAWNNVLAKSKEYEEANPESMSSQTRPNDILSKILGPDRRGRVRRSGFGATPSNTFRSASSR